jgi:A/G-specific adenine glycosylase
VKDDTKRAYLILISEVMLQQTQVPRVEITFKRFVRTFPSLSALAKASNRDVLIAWRGMGYNSRALRLRDAARTIVEKFGGGFPRDFDELRSIKGIGPYTAAAIRNFAFNLPTPCLDTNIRRILHRVFFGPEGRDGRWRTGDGRLLEVAASLLAQACHPEPFGFAQDKLRRRMARSSKSRFDSAQRDTCDWHSALMDFGSLVCTKNSPRCALCPMKKFCPSFDRLNQKRTRHTTQDVRRKEPGREIAGKFVPDRIIRGRIVEELRDAEGGLKVQDIGVQVCIDWNPKEHKVWLQKLLKKLETDGLIAGRRATYVLAD